MKILELLTRRADQTRDEALTYWTDRHAALVKQRMEGNGVVRRYVNNVGLTKQPATSVPPFDGVVGAWLRLDPSIFATQITMPGNPVVADEPNFLACRPVPMLVDEYVVREPARRGTAKLIIFLRREPDLDRDAFEAALLQEHAQSMSAAWGEMLVGLTVNFGRPMPWGRMGAGMAALRRGDRTAHREGRSTARPDRPCACDAGCKRGVPDRPATRCGLTHQAGL